MLYQQIGSWRVINQLKMNYNSEMEKAMFQSHGIGYERYCNDFSARMKVEARREEDYNKEKRLLQELGNTNS
ncbi:hypothetical protein [Litchfieldia salsa]|uniref:hypothetical protein n=1 Tax=Litchfieldia salsa TaxID=930152 RepID=UPI0015874B4B|nr:hypothetical protein [Litchfieldia salsa]